MVDCWFGFVWEGLSVRLQWSVVGVIVIVLVIGVVVRGWVYSEDLKVCWLGCSLCGCWCGYEWYVVAVALSGMFLVWL